MSKQKVTCFLVAFLLIAGTGGLLTQARNHQKLGLPGIKTHPISGSNRLRADLPEKVLNYTSEELDDDDITVKALPADTSFGQRRYFAPDGFHVDLKVVLMGTDRTSLHKPQFCLPGQGWQIDDKLCEETHIAVDRPCRYDLPVVKLVTQATVDGQRVNANGLYVYWYVCEDGVSASVSGSQRMWWTFERLLRSGVLQRWAYVSCWTTCQPGQEKATFERMKRFIADSVPEFQLVPKPPTTVITAHQ
jgi:hypothetical protein